jgi:hypothetical protein
MYSPTQELLTQPVDEYESLAKLKLCAKGCGNLSLRRIYQVLKTDEF